MKEGRRGGSLEVLLQASSAPGRNFAARSSLCSLPACGWLLLPPPLPLVSVLKPLHTGLSG